MSNGAFICLTLAERWRTVWNMTRRKTRITESRYDGERITLYVQTESPVWIHDVEVAVTYLEHGAHDEVVADDASSLCAIDSRQHRALAAFARKWVETHQDECIMAAIMALRDGVWYAPKDSDEQEPYGCCGGNSCSRCV